MKKIIKPVKRIFGEIAVPGDKSISHRAIMLGAIARGRTAVKNILDCDDCNYTMAAFRDMGVSIEKRDEMTFIGGRGLKGLVKPNRPLSAGNSGTTVRILSGILAGQDFETTLTGDESLSKRPMKRIIEPLSSMGAAIKARDGDHIPLTIRGGALRPMDCKLAVPSAQVKSAILFAGLYPDGVTTVEEKFKTRDHTERMMKYFGADVKTEGLKVSIAGGRELTGKTLEIPGDISSASFFIVAAVLLKASKIRIKDVNVNPTRAGILDILSRMGANVKVLNKKEGYEPVADIEVESGDTRGITIEERETPGIIDELPIIFVLASLSKGKTLIKGVKELRVKETDRIVSMKENLEKMGAGAGFKVEGDDVMIEGVEKLKGSDLKSFGDHRTCMSMAVAALAADGASSIDDAECVNKSFPGFFNLLERSHVE
ncbi:MAG: 3-phosphoshikimate 1-carboxyvinyltransferase [Candidatus Omnitrophica bacterium]|nr:3-phosphoshikimate 1-carboxyvinyltransferase [Candidatus Omnitrophota bacterium]